MKVWGVLAALVAVLVLPTGAAAKSGTHATLSFNGSNGYRIEVEASSGSESPVLVDAKNGAESVRFVLLGSMDADGSLDVHLPHVGRIAVEFVPQNEKRRPLPSGCSGRRTVVASGHFRGMIELHGERNYMNVDRDSARGRVVHVFRKICGKGARGKERTGPSSEEPGVKTGTVIVATPNEGSTVVAAGLLQTGPQSLGTEVFAVKTRYRGGMVITSSVSGRGGPDEFSVSPTDGSKALELTPPNPFAGSARFELTSPRTATWWGDLTVDLPGVGQTRLAGRSFESTRCADSHCTNTVRPELKLLAKLFAAILGLASSLAGQQGAGG